MWSKFSHFFNDFRTILVKRSKKQSVHHILAFSLISHYKQFVSISQRSTFQLFFRAEKENQSRVKMKVQTIH